jgi:lipoprotein NlpD
MSMKPFTYLTIPSIAVLMIACSSTPMAPAPVVERSVGTASSSNVAAPRPIPQPTSVQTPMAAPVNVVTPKPVIFNDGKSYAVKKGDTLYAIALENGLSYRDLAEWNGITNPSYIQIDQVLRLTAPLSGAVVAAPVTAQPVPVNPPGAVANPVPVSTPVAAGPAPIAAPTPTLATAPVTAPPASELVWQWPSKGKLGAGFVDGKSKGIDMTGNMGDAVVAAADGKVVYAGSALKGYGQMLIVKHSDVYLTAYAHNSKLLVKEDQAVKRGQKIAEMGNSESDNGQTKLHFELRRSGKPVDPLKFLPAQ